MAVIDSFVGYLSKRCSDIDEHSNAKICLNQTDGGQVLFDAFKMFAPNVSELSTLFCNEGKHAAISVKLGSSELIEMMQVALELNEQFNEAEYMRYILRKIFARYQVEGKLSISICKN
jgi:hypothetical protein